MRSTINLIQDASGCKRPADTIRLELTEAESTMFSEVFVDDDNAVDGFAVECFSDGGISALEGSDYRALVPVVVEVTGKFIDKHGWDSERPADTRQVARSLRRKVKAAARASN